MNKEKNGLSRDYRRKPDFKEYVEDGYNVTEMFLPDSNFYMITKEKGDKVFYYYHSPSYSSNGVYSKADYEKFNQQMDAWNAELNRRISDWETECTEWEKRLNKYLSNSPGNYRDGVSLFPEFPDFPDAPNLPRLPRATQSASENIDFAKDFEGIFDEFLKDSDTGYQHTSSTTRGSSRSTSSKEYYKKQTHSSSSSSCLGCLVWTILLLCLTCVILYGMGVLGGNIIRFFADLFKSIF